jgi:hypothetical protein
MEIQSNQINLNNQRIPTNSVYDIIITIIIASAILWIIYTSTPYSHYSFYLIENNNK